MVSPSQVTAVLAQATRLASHSWEWGTVAEALLEWHNPELSVFSANAFPNGSLPTDFNPNEIESLKYVKPHIRLDSETLTPDSSLGDPSSLGVSALLLSRHSPPYLSASTRQNTHLLAGRTWDGALSHRETATELWSDNMYMCPPFLAYYAVATANVSALRYAAGQPVAYAAKLRLEEGEGEGERAWMHIRGKPGDAQTPEDTGLWSTGNAWAAAGMSRVLATVVHSAYAAELTSETEKLTDLIHGILSAARTAPLDEEEPGTGLVRNYIADDSWWGEIAGTSLLAATAYRMLKLAPEVFGEEWRVWADERREAVERRIGEDGIVSPAVNPLNWGDRERFETGSPEGQAFVGLMAAAWRDSLEEK